MNRETSIRISGVDKSAYANDHVKNDIARTLSLAHVHSSPAIGSSTAAFVSGESSLLVRAMPFQSKQRFGLYLEASSHVFLWLVFEHHSC